MHVILYKFVEKHILRDCHFSNKWESYDCYLNIFNRQIAKWSSNQSMVMSTVIPKMNLTKVAVFVNLDPALFAVCK